MKEVDCGRWYNKLLTILPWIKCRAAPPPPPPPNPRTLCDWPVGRSCIAVDPAGAVHVASDNGGGPGLVVANVSTGSVEVFDAQTYNPATKQLFNPSMVFTRSGMQLVSAWWFTFEIPAGCKPLVLWRKPGQLFQAMEVNPTPQIDWQITHLSDRGNNRVVVWGAANNYAVLNCEGDRPYVEAHGNFASGSHGGGEKESRMIVMPGGVDPIWHVCNSGCRRNGAAFYRDSVSCTIARSWASYGTYGAMGNDDRGHSSVCGDLKHPGIGYMFASWQPFGLVYNVWDPERGKMAFSVDSLPVVSKSGWAGMVKTFLGVAPRPAGGAYFTFVSGGKVCLGLVTPGAMLRKVDVVAEGTTPSITVLPDNTPVLVYNTGASLVCYRAKGLAYEC